MRLTKNILVVAPDALYRQGVKIALTQGEPVRQPEFSETEKLTAKHVLQGWDLIILSEQTLTQNRIHTVRQLIRATDVPVLVISDHMGPDSLYKSRRIGAQGLVFSYSGLVEVYRVANKLLSGRHHWPVVREQSSLNESSRTKRAVPKPPKLTERQEQVLEYVKVGLSNKQISYHMNLSESTVKSHMSVLLRKYDVPTRTKLVSKL